MEAFVNSRTELARALCANKPRSGTPHTVVLLPSYSVGDSLLAHYSARIPELEHRFLLSLLMLPRVPGCEIVFVTCLAPQPEVLDYYLSLVPSRRRQDVATRIRMLVVPDRTPRPVSAKLLDRPDLIARLRQMVRGRLAYVEPYNVTPLETELSRRLGLPLNGTAPELWPLGFKSAGRKIMRRAGVPLPLGQEDVRSPDDVVAAAMAIRKRHPQAVGVVVKADNSGAGDGNRVIRFSHACTVEQVRSAVEAFEPWYLADILRGGVVEELVVGTAFTSPSVQVDIDPDGHVTVLSTHEQLLGGDDGQVYEGCRFPADEAYGNRLASYGNAVGEVLARRGALGRFCVDFAAVQRPSGRWEVYGLEINLRKSGTSHPYTALRNLAPGCYDGPSGRWHTDDGEERCYRSTDNLVDPNWYGRPADDVISAVRTAGLEFDRQSRTGVVLHMLCGLDIDARIGLTAIGTSPDHADSLYQAAVTALSVDAVQSRVPLPV
ncbi:MAG TPA: peptide ligase PGM1-related protein [Nocardioidaceae bacterium]|nr:peptide ligase PGM1-related protein [Nocardioidaceae bacterium]